MRILEFEIGKAALKQRMQPYCASTVILCPFPIWEPMATLPRKRLGPYEFLSSIAAGGIGRIYRVRNTLNREVALNPLPEVFSSHRDHTPRFERTGLALAALKHPPVAALYSLEGNFVPAENLAARHQQHQQL